MKKGQTILFVLFLLAVLGILSGALTGMWQSELMTRSSERDGLIAIYLAQAGIERAKVEVRANPALTSIAWQNLGSGRYSVTITNAGGNQRLLQSIGQRLDASGNVLAERQVQVTVRGMGTPPTADDAQVGWSWSEI